MKLVSPFIKKLYTISALVLLIALNGCGGDSSSSSSFTPADPEQLILNISADAIEIPSDGNTVITLTSILQNQDGNPIDGNPVNFASSSGRITIINDENALGTTLAQLTISSPALVDVIVTASVDAISETLILPVVGTTLVLDVQDSSALEKSVPIELTLLDSSNQPIAGETISLSSALGNPFDNSAPITNSEGKATVSLSTNIEGTEFLSASALNNTVSSAQKQLTVETQFILSISADATEIPSDGNTVITLTSVLHDQDGSPIDGNPINFVSSSGQITIIDDGDALGTASAQLTISSSALVNVIVTASAGATSESLSLPVVGTTLVMNAQDSSTSGKSVPVELTLLDSSNQPIVGETIALSSTLGNPFDNSAPTTNSEGKATVFLTTNIEGTEFLSASALNNTVSSAQKQITVEPILFILSISAGAVEIPSDGKTIITLTSILKDQEEYPIVGVPINFVSSSGQITIIDDGNTNAQGTVSAQLTISSPALVDVTVTASVDAVSESLSLPVVGTTLTMSVQDSSAVGKSVPIELTLLDSSNKPIEGETITLSSMLGNSFDTSAPITNSEGKATAFLSTNFEGKEILSASALSNTVSSAQNQINIDSNVFSLMQSDVDGNPVFQSVPFSETGYIKLTWSSDSAPVTNQTVSLSTTKGIFVSSGDLFAELDTEDNGEIIIAIEDQEQPGLATVTATGIEPGDDESDALSANIEITFVSDDPQQITLAALPPSINVTETSTVSVLVTDALGNPVPYTVVALSITDSGGGAISPGEIITDLNGLAEATFTPNRSAQIIEAAEITGTVRSNTSVTSNVLITVSEESLGVTIGTGNTTFVTKQETSYLIQYIARVTDINGLGIPDANVDVSIAPYEYHKGYYQPTDGSGNGQQTDPGDYSSLDFDRWTVVITTDPACPNEDVNANGLLDSGEDTNGDSVLSPGQVASLDPQVNGEISLTDEFGETYIDIRYPQDHASWVRYEITATITTDQNTVVKDVALPWLPVDFDDLTSQDLPPANENSPWGRSNNCANID